MTARQRVDALAKLQTLSSDEHHLLRESGLTDETVWAPKKEHPLYKLVTSFKSEVKTYYYWGQECRCCYCSSELPKHGRSFDAEHILDKSTYRQFMFNLNNFGVACPVCKTRLRRQIIIVTHNANLIVNTDADQVIVAKCGPHRPGQLPEIRYQSGGLENPDIRRQVCEILEGGEAAFKERARRLRVRM